MEKPELKVGQVWINKAGRLVTIERMEVDEDGVANFDGREEFDEDETPWSYNSDGTLCGYSDQEPETLTTLIKCSRQEKIDAATRKLVESLDRVREVDESDEYAGRVWAEVWTALAELKEASK